MIKKARCSAGFLFGAGCLSGSVAAQLSRELLQCFNAARFSTMAPVFQLLDQLLGGNPACLRCSNQGNDDGFGESQDHPGCQCSHSCIDERRDVETTLPPIAHVVRHGVILDAVASSDLPGAEPLLQCVPDETPLGL